MEDLLLGLVQAPTELGHEEPGQALMTEAFRDCGLEPRDVHLQSVVEEECTGNGTLQCLIDGTTADACVITEPHPDHLTIAQVGVLWFQVDVVGRPAHAAYATTGHNAIEAANSILTELR